MAGLPTNFEYLHCDNNNEIWKHSVDPVLFIGRVYNAVAVRERTYHE